MASYEKELICLLLQARSSEFCQLTFFWFFLQKACPFDCDFFIFCSHFFFLYQLTLMSIIAMTLFFRTEMHKNSVSEGGVYSGALFYSLALMMFIGMPEISMTIGGLPVFYKQRDLLFYPSWAFSLPSWILRIPVTLIQTTIWVALTYYVIGYDPNVGR